MQIAQQFHSTLEKKKHKRLQNKIVVFLRYKVIQTAQNKNFNHKTLLHMLINSKIDHWSEMQIAR